MNQILILQVLDSNKIEVSSSSLCTNLKKKVYFVGIVLTVVLALIGLFFETIDDSLYENINGKPLLTESNIRKMDSLSSEAQNKLRVYGLKKDVAGGATYISYWSGDSGFIAHRDSEGMYSFTFSVSGDSAVALRKPGTFDQKRANRVVDKVIGRGVKEELLSLLDAVD